MLIIFVPRAWVVLCNLGGIRPLEMGELLPNGYSYPRTGSLTFQSYCLLSLHCNPNSSTKTSLAYSKSAPTIQLLAFQLLFTVCVSPLAVLTNTKATPEVTTIVLSASSQSDKIDMDLVSVGYLILTLEQVTKNAYSLTNSIKYSTPKVDQIHYQILAEKATTEAWANQMRITNGRDSAPSIPPDKLDGVTKLLSKLVEYVKAAEDKYAKVKSKSADKKNTIANLRPRALFMLSGYNDLKDLVDVIASMNKALLMIAPALPPYPRHMYPEGSIRPQIQHLMLDDHDTNSQGSEAQPSSTPVSMDGTTAVGPTFSRTQTKQLSRIGTDISARSVYGLEHLPSLRSIYELCLNAMDMMAHRGRHALLQNSSARLKLWGAGIFELPVPLDTVLMLREKDSNAVRKVFLKAMAYILVRLGMLLPHPRIHSVMSNTAVERSLRRLRDSVTNQTGDLYRQQSIMQAEIPSMLGTDELVEYSLVSWANSLQRQKDLAAVLRQHPTRKPDDLHDIEAMLDYHYILKLIEILFHLLPAIRNERETYSFWREAEQAAKDGDTESLTASIRANSTVEMICTKLRISSRKELSGRVN